MSSRSPAALLCLALGLVQVVVGLLVASSRLRAQEPASTAVEAHFRVGQEAIQKGELTAAVGAFGRVVELDPGNGRGWLLLGYSLHGLGRLDDALPVHEKATHFPSVAHIAAYNVACVHSLRGHKEEAFEWLRKALDLGFRDPVQLATDSDLDPIRRDPRFAGVVEGSSAGLQVYSPVTDRRSARVAFFDGKGSPAQINIDHGVLRWRREFEDRVDDERLVGRHWRLGSDFWTTLDTSVPLVMAGVPVPAGYWYLTLTHRGNHRFVLGLHDPAHVRTLRIDPHRADRLDEGIEVPMHYECVERVQRELMLQITVLRGRPDKGLLSIAFGPHRLEARVRIEIDR